MNRKQRRKLKKVIGAFDGLYKKWDGEHKAYLSEGEKVKLNVEKITSHISYPSLVPEYREFIKDNKDTVFTVGFDKKDKERGSIPSHTVVLEEDTSRVRWLFHDTDLLVQDDNGEFIAFYKMVVRREKNETV